MDYKEKIANLLAKEIKFDTVKIFELLEVPPGGLGDFAFPCFVLAKEIKKNPIEIAKELAGKINGDFLEKIEAKGPYINFFISKGNLSSSVLTNIFEGHLIDATEKGKVMVEYSSPNTNKPLHLGHLRNNALGLAISNLLEEKGLKITKANLVNDRGIHICKSMLAYKLFGEGKEPKNMKSDHLVGDMYVLYNEKLKTNPALEDQAKEMLKKWEAKDKETIYLWKKMNKWALDGMKETYDLFGSQFDEWFFESKIFEKGDAKKIIQEGLSKEIFKHEDNGAIAANLEPELPNKIIVRGDGTSLYATNDLALTQYKFDKFKLQKSIWVVGNEQDLYFKQLFSIFDKLKRNWAENCFHLSYGMVNLTSGKMKSREGTVVDADDIINEMQKIALDEIEKRYKDLSKKEKEERALSIALGAIKFFLLKNAAKKEITFNPVESLSFEGETGPYLQYTYARAKSILRKANEKKIKYKKGNFELLEENKEKELIIALTNFSSSVEKSWEQLSLHPLAHNLLKIAEKFNSYYHEVPVLKSSSKELINARLSLVEATTIVLAKGLAILDIDAIEKM
jgi:arginyl-tRNA synthetase